MRIKQLKKISHKITNKIMTEIKEDIGGYKMEFKYLNTISEIEYSDEYENHTELFEKGIDILKNRIVNNNYEEFSEEESDLLTEISTIINKE